MLTAARTRSDVVHVRIATIGGRLRQTVVERAEWARVAGRKWHWIKEGVNTEGVGHRIVPACSMMPGMGNARPFSQGKDTRLSVGIPPNRMKGRRYWSRPYDHLCQHCVIAAASNGYRFG